MITKKELKKIEKKLREFIKNKEILEELLNKLDEIWINNKFKNYEFMEAR